MTRWLLSGCLLLLAVPAQAAEPEPDAAADAAETVDTTTPPEDIDAVLAEEIRAAEAAAASVPAADSNESFIPTVQISEDLSVSFPVDI